MLIGTARPDCYARTRNILLSPLFPRTSSVFRRAFWTGTVFLLAMTVSTVQAESRKIFDSESPSWMRAVGKLQVPGIKIEQGYQQNYREDCSATLITDTKSSAAKSASADIIVTAWHCLEFYGDLSRTITFTLLYGTTESFSSEAYRLFDGNNMEADWAVLRLLQPVPADKVAALAVHSGRANTHRAITMAGYSKNALQARLSYDPDCAITSTDASGGIASNCNALKGASGGAVVQISDQGEPLLAGVISRGDGQGLSVFVPVDAFRSAIQASLR